MLSKTNNSVRLRSIGTQQQNTGCKECLHGWDSRCAAMGRMSGHFGGLSVPTFDTHMHFHEHWDQWNSQNPVQKFQIIQQLTSMFNNTLLESTRDTRNLLEKGQMHVNTPLITFTPTYETMPNQSHLNSTQFLTSPKDATTNTTNIPSIDNGATPAQHRRMETNTASNKKNPTKNDARKMLWQLKIKNPWRVNKETKPRKLWEETHQNGPDTWKKRKLGKKVGHPK